MSLPAVEDQFSNNVGIQENACRVLQKLVCAEHQVDIKSVVEAVLSAMREYPGAPKVQEHGCGLLSAVAVHSYVDLAYR